MKIYATLYYLENNERENSVLVQYKKNIFKSSIHVKATNTKPSAYRTLDYNEKNLMGNTNSC